MAVMKIKSFDHASRQDTLNSTAYYLFCENTSTQCKGMKWT